MQVSTSSRERASGSSRYRSANRSGVMIVRGFTGTGGIFTPLQGVQERHLVVPRGAPQ